MSRENYYILLELQIYPPENNIDRIERAIEEKWHKWSEIYRNAPPSRARKAEAYLEMLPDIRRVMSDAGARREEAKQAIIKEKEKYEKIDEAIELVSLDGSITEEAVSELSRMLAVDEAVIRDRIKVPIVQTRVVEKLEPSIYRQITGNLKIIEKKSLYDFLGASADSGLDDLRANAEKIAADLKTNSIKDTKYAAKQVLIGHCFDLFKTDEKRRQYDASLAYQRLDELNKYINIAGINNGIISVEAFDFLMERAAAMGIEPGEAQEHILEYCEEKKWHVHVPTQPRIQAEKKCSPVNIASSTGYQGIEFYKNSWALVVGINNYEQEEIQNLRFAENDARAVASALPALGFPEKNIKLLLSGETKVTRETIYKVLEKEFNPNMNEKDRFLFYFAGHGVSYKANNQERGYILVQDSELCGRMPNSSEPYLNKMPIQSLEMSQFLDLVKLLPVKHKLLLIDSCFSGFMTYTRRVTDDSANINKKLSQWRSEPVTQVITAGRSGQSSYEREVDQHGVFTRHLLKGLQGFADPRGEGIISFLDLAAYISDRVAREANVNQDPQAGTCEGEGQFFFLLPGNNKTAPNPGS